MRFQTVLGGFVIVRGHHKPGIGTDLLGKGLPLDGRGCRIGACPGNDGYAPAGNFHRTLDDVAAFLGGERRVLPGRAGRNKPVRTLFDLMFDHALERSPIDGIILERGDEGGEGASKHDG